MFRYPDFYNPEHAERYAYEPGLRDVASAALDHAREHKIAPAAMDTRRVALLVIDAQRDFCFPEGSLYVGGRSGKGAMDDNRRLVEFIYRELPHITGVHVTLDTHEAFQIFSPVFWLDESNRPLLPHDMIDSKCMVLRGGKSIGRALPNPAVADMLGIPYLDLVRQVHFYVEQLEVGGKTGKHMLYIWPEHCILGSSGHVLAGCVQEARMFHAYARFAENIPILKGRFPLSENYSVFSPEVTMHWSGTHQIAAPNVAFLESLLQHDFIVVAGQALSHCVQSSVDDLLSALIAIDPVLVRKVCILEDCMSAVVVPGVVDYTDAGIATLERYREMGVRIIRSTDPLDAIF